MELQIAGSWAGSAAGAASAFSLPKVTGTAQLRNVRATAVRGRALDLRARFHIDAELRVDPAPRVAFETEVELTTGYATIREFR